MKYFAHFGHCDFILCLGYRGDLIKKYFLDYDECLSNDFRYSQSGKSLELFNSDIHDWKITFADTGFRSNIGQRLLAVEQYVADEEVFLANYTDGLTDLDLARYLAYARRRDRIATFLSVKPNLSYHIAETNSDGLVTGMVTERDISRHRAIVAPVSDERLRDDLERFARAALEIAGARDFARLDILKVGNRLYALDIKVQPAVPDPLFDACALISGLDANQSVTAMFVAGFARLFLEGVAVIAIPSRLRSMMPKPVFSILYG